MTPNDDELWDDEDDKNVSFNDEDINPEDTPEETSFFNSDWLQRQIRLNNKREIADNQRNERRIAYKTACEELSPAQLADQIHDTLSIPVDSDFSDYYHYLGKQLGVLNTVFYTKLHEAGLGFEHALGNTPTQVALQAQSLCRQTFEAIKNLDHAGLGKRREEPQK